MTKYEVLGIATESEFFVFKLSLHERRKDWTVDKEPLYRSNPVDHRIEEPLTIM